ncbi:MAG: N-6 DNA methylase [Bdellovibrionota bacterium]
MQTTSNTAYSSSNEISFWVGEILFRLFPRSNQSTLGKLFPEIEMLGIKPLRPKQFLNLPIKDLILATAFQSQRITFSTQERADHGSYYTDSNEIEKLYKQIDIKNVSKLLEPGCGAGCLIIQYLYMLKTEKKLSCFPEIKAFDMNEKAVTFAKLLIKLAMKDLLGDSFGKVFAEKVNIQCRDILKIDFRFKEEFDLILMNPPYAQLKGEKVSSDKGKYGKGNFTNLFMEYGFENLSKKGQILYILGGPSKWGNSYRDINEKLLNEFKFIDFIPSLNGFMDIEYDTFAFLARKSEGKNENKAQRKVNTLCFHVNSIEERILNATASKGVPLTSLLAEVTRGAYIPAKLKITSGRKNFISSGSNINSFTLNSVDGTCEKEYWKKIFDTKRVILKAKRGKLLHSTICNEGIATTDNLVNMSLKDKDWTLEGISLLLNSSYMSFFAHTFVFCSESELARIIDKPYLEKFLVPNLSEIELAKFNFLAKRIFQLTQNKDYWHFDLERDSQKIEANIIGSEENILLREADEIIFTALGLDQKEKEYIFNKFSKVLHSLKPSQKLAA